MSDVRGISEDVRFDFDAARHLAARFRATASELDDQIGRRASLAGTTREEWRGRYAEEFDARTRLGLGDARLLADRLWAAAVEVERMAETAREEQSRRERAREWYEQQKASNPLEWVADKFSDWLFGDDVPPDLRPSEGPRVALPDTAVRANRD